MRKIIFLSIVQYLLFLTSRVESLTGQTVTVVDNDRYPFVAALQSNHGVHLCTGVLVTTKYVITIAHCLENLTPARVQVVFRNGNSSTPTVRYVVSSWITYNTWANIRGLVLANVRDQIAIVQLHRRIIVRPFLIPIRLNDLNQKQIEGKIVTMTGWKSVNNEKVLQKANVTIFRKEECENKIELVTNIPFEMRAGELCSASSPYVLSECGDIGAPVLDANDTLIAVNIGDCPRSGNAWGNFTEDFLRKYKLNIYIGIEYYNAFIVGVTGYRH